MGIPQMVKELMKVIPNGGVSGGGHLVVGSIKFVGGMRKDVLAKLAEKIAACGVDEVKLIWSCKRANVSTLHNDIELFNPSNLDYYITLTLS